MVAQRWTDWRGRSGWLCGTFTSYLSSLHLWPPLQVKGAWQTEEEEVKGASGHRRFARCPLTTVIVRAAPPFRQMATALDRKANRPRLDSLRSTTSSSYPSLHRPPSPTFSSTTTGSLPHGANFPLVSRKDLRNSIDSFEELMDSAKELRLALLAKAEATARFATALEACSR